MEYIHNYFFKPHGEGRYAGTYTIVDDNLSLPFLKDGQRFLIAGSDLNFGVYTYHANGIKNDDDTEAAGLKPETFAGTICALAVPPAVIALAGEISEWVENNGASVDSPYTSESVIGVYSSLMPCFSATCASVDAFLITAALKVAPGCHSLVYPPNGSSCRT